MSKFTLPAKKPKKLPHNEESLEETKLKIKKYYFDAYDIVYQECLTLYNYLESINKLSSFKFDRKEYILVYSFCLEYNKLFKTSHIISQFITDVIENNLQKLLNFAKKEKENLKSSKNILSYKKHLYNIIITIIYMLNIVKKINMYFYKLYNMDELMIININNTVTNLEIFIVEIYDELLTLILIKNNIFELSLDITTNTLSTFVSFIDDNKNDDLDICRNNMILLQMCNNRVDCIDYKNIIEKRIDILLSIVKKII